ncbi:MAG TPA: cation:proton antiporter [Solirubrobacterales bacterium]|nr:cation:proton antiporter [Solirubrobacterales bacterium]
MLSFDRHADLAAVRGWDFGDLYSIGLVVFGVALFAAVVALSQQRERAFSAAVVYLVMGAGISAGLSAVGLDLLDPVDDAKIIERAAEFAVIVALFASGIKLDRMLSVRGWASTIRLIGIVMPLTIAGVAVFADLAMGLSLGAAIVLGAVLAPTDPVLAGEVQVGPPGEEDEPEPRFALTSEAGLNDGLAFPFVFLGLHIAEGNSDWVGEWLSADLIYPIVVGLAVGALAGWGLGAGSSALRRRGWLIAEYDGWLAIAAVLAVYGLTEAIGAYGFLAAFAGGLAFRRQERHHEYHARVHGGAETVGKVSELAVILLIGSTVTVAGLLDPGLAGWLLAPVLLFVIRPAAVLLSSARSRLDRGQRVFLAWFGVRGIGSFYYAAVAIASGYLTAAEGEKIYWTVIVCAGISIVLHGITATPLSERLERRAR